jgi:hypothetical protein
VRGELCEQDRSAPPRSSSSSVQHPYSTEASFGEACSLEKERDSELSEKSREEYRTSDTRREAMAEVGDDVESWLRSHGLTGAKCFARDKQSAAMERIQGRHFLRSDVRPCIGQRVELAFVDLDLPASVFREVGPRPGGICPMKNCEDRGPGNGSMEVGTVRSMPSL